MTNVISKLIDKTEKTCESLNINIPRRYVASSIVAACLLAYSTKVAYPIIENFLNKNNTRQDSVNNNLTIKQIDNNKKKNEVNNKKEKKSISRRERLKNSIPALNLIFIIQFIKLVRIMIPNVLCTETLLLSGHTLFLILRTFLSIYVANLEGAIVKYIVRKDPTNFVKQLLKWFGVAIPATFINSMIRYLECRIALSFRSRLVEHSHRLYFKNQAYYRVTVLDARLENCAQRLTDDIETVSSTVSHLYGQITKPCFDILLMAIALANLTKKRNANIITGPILISGVVMVSALILRLVSPKFGQLVAQEAEKKGYLRHVHSRLVSNSEEIAFYGGHKVELSHLKNAYGLLVQHLEYMYGVKLWFVMLEQFLMKYVWSGTGMIVVSLPILMAAASNNTNKGNIINGDDDNISERTHYFTTAKNLLLTGSNAVERLMSSYKDVVELAGHTARVANMFSVLEEVSRGVYHKTVVEKKDATLGFVVEFKGSQPVAKGKFFFVRF